jgi:hypothetical protein
VAEREREGKGMEWAAGARWAGREGGPAEKVRPRGEGKKKEREEGCWARPRGEGERGFGRFWRVFFSLKPLN